MLEREQMDESADGCDGWWRGRGERIRWKNGQNGRRKEPGEEG